MTFFIYLIALGLLTMGGLAIAASFTPSFAARFEDNDGVDPAVGTSIAFGMGAIQILGAVYLTLYASGVM